MTLQAQPPQDQFPTEQPGDIPPSAKDPAADLVAVEDLPALLARLDDQNLSQQVLRIVDDLEAQQRTPATRFYRFRALTKLERWEERNTLRDQVQQQESRQLYDHLLLGNWHRDQGELWAAKEHANAALELDPEHTECKLLHLRLLDDWLRRVQKRDAFDEFVRIGKHYAASDPIIRREWIKNLYPYELSEQARLLETYCTEHPDDGTAHKYLGNIYVQLADGEKALPPLERAVELLPGQGNVQVVLANALTWLERFDDAQAAHDKAIEFEPTSISYHARGLFHLFRGKTELAVADFTAAEQNRPPSDYTLRSAVQALVQRQQPNQAIQLLDDVMLDDPPRTDDCCYLKSLILAMENRHADALIAIEEAIAASDRQFRYYLELRLQKAQCLFEVGKHDQAISLAEQVATEHPAHQLAEQTLAELRERHAAINK